MSIRGTPRISVALPVRNGADYLRDALDSVLAQDFDDFELCVSDNASTDATPAILAEYAARDSRVRVSRSPTLLPQATNVNRAVGLCRAPWVKLLCHDDLLHPHCLRTIVEAVSRDGTRTVLVVGNGEEHLFGNGHRYRHLAADGPVVQVDGPTFVRTTLEGRGPAPTPSLTTATVRRDAWAATAGFDARYVHFDVFYWLQLLLDGDLLHVPEVLTVNRIHGRQVFAEARRTLQTIDDYRRFPREYLAAHGGRLGLGWRARFAMWLRPTLNTGTIIAMELLAGRISGARSIVARTPAQWWPLLPAAVTRAMIAEVRKLRRLRPHVPMRYIYPT